MPSYWFIPLSVYNLNNISDRRAQFYYVKNDYNLQVFERKYTKYVNIVYF